MKRSHKNSINGGTLTSPRMGPVKRKVVLLLLAGVGLAFARTPNQQYRIMGGVYREWQEINRLSLMRAVASLEHSKVVRTKKQKDGSVSLELTQNGTHIARRLYLNELTLKRHKHWDGKWRIVMYDVPERERAFRYDLCYTLKHLGFCELQHSVLVYPFDCQKEIELVIKTYKARKYVRYVIAEHVSNESALRKHFHLG